MKPLNIKFVDAGEVAAPIILRVLSFDDDVQEAGTGLLTPGGFK
ncbi:MAG TPA: hypothetical protein PLK94_13840 [Alphaproteobacteria bacterium]|jgi:hypothetical protein|nr:hypothetical protein [Alphaproteobacteria bacterium]